MFKSNNKLSSQGVTLVEVLVSLFIFGVALGALLFLLTTVLTNADELRNNTVAAGLAQEGLEVVRNLRDQDIIASQSFGFSIPNGVYEVQWDSNSLTTVPPGATRLIKKDSATGLFSYGLGNDTQFRRVLIIATPIPNVPYEKIVTASVSWRSADGVTRSLRAESHLYNWY